jgi:hypothetical protein
MYNENYKALLNETKEDVSGNTLMFMDWKTVLFRFQ